MQPLGCVNAPPDRVVRAVELPVPPEQVWKALADATRLGEWLDADVELDLRPGGAARFRFGSGEERRGLVTEVEAERRLAITWWPLGAGGVGPATTVTFEVEPVPAGSRLRVIESRAARTRAAVA
jgi:uncharacterized protein YndB with AHSA1/START domain